MTRPCSTRPPGFTLLELLVAVAVLGMVTLLLDQGIAFGLRASAMQGRLGARQADLDAVDRALRQIVLRADPGTPPLPASFRGTSTGFSTVTELPDPATGTPERVEASLGVSGGELRLRWRPRRHVTAFTPPPPGAETVLLTGLRTLQIDYFSGQAWTASWAAPKLPVLVRLRLVFDPDGIGGGRHWPPIIAAPLRKAPP